jgi:cytochrome P450 family 2 subfamily U polypeptide 1
MNYIICINLPDLNYDLIFADLFQASSNTTSSYLESLFLYMILYPEVQEKIYQEIQTTIVPGQDVTYEHKSR